MNMHGIAKALLSGMTGYQGGQREGEAARREQEAAAAKLARERQLQAAREALMASQARAEDAQAAAQSALAFQRLQSEPVDPLLEDRRGEIQARTRAAEALAAARSRADAPDPLLDARRGELEARTRAANALAAARERATTGQGAPRPRTQAQEDNLEEDEATGWAIMEQYGARSTFPNEDRTRFWNAYTAVKRQNPDLPNGRAAVMALEGMHEADPSTRPLGNRHPPQMSAFDQQFFSEMGMEGAPEAAAPPVRSIGQDTRPPAPTPRRPADPLLEDDDEAELPTLPADRWDELVSGGMDPEEATARVKREYGL